MPKKVLFDFVVPDSPDAVSKRLRAKTRLRMVPNTSSILGKGALGGRISGRKFVVSRDPRTFIQHLLPTATGTLEERSDGSTRVVGAAGLGWFSTYSYRAAFIMLPIMLAVVMYDTNIRTEPLMAGAVIAAFSVFCALMFVLLGTQVAKAEDEIDELISQVQASACAEEVGQKAKASVRSVGKSKVVE